jgi:hypothetical protein
MQELLPHVLSVSAHVLNILLSKDVPIAIPQKRFFNGR